jgi:hypothetical protein
LGKPPARLMPLLVVASVTVTFFIVNDTMIQMRERSLQAPRSAVGDVLTITSAVDADAVEGAAEATGRTCMKQPPRVTEGPRCAFDGCPAGGPYMYIATSYRNRGAAFNRWLRTLVLDVNSGQSPISGKCICSVVADYNDVLYGPTIAAALEDWPFR